MGLGHFDQKDQQPLWITPQQLAKGPGHPFYERINRLFVELGFDDFVENLCAKFYAGKMGRPGIPPGVYFRMLLIGYLEALDSDRLIAWRCKDSLSLRSFLRCGWDEETPDHSSMTVIRKRLDLETHRQVMRWMLEALADHGLLSGKSLGVDATTAEANAAMRSIVRRDSGAGYQEYLEQLAQQEGIAEPTAEDRKRIDKKRKNKASNREWKSPQDGDARVAKMKDGSTHLAHKVEHAVDLDSGAIVAVTVQPADRGDTESLIETMAESQKQLEAVEKKMEAAGSPALDPVLMEELVTDGGYYSQQLVTDLVGLEIETYIADGKVRKPCCDPEKPCDPLTAACLNRERIRSERGRDLRRKRGELVERSFQHCYGRGNLRRMHLRGHENILKRLLIHVAGFNLSILLRKVMGAGTPKQWKDVVVGILCAKMDPTVLLLVTRNEQIALFMYFSLLSIYMSVCENASAANQDPTKFGNF